MRARLRLPHPLTIAAAASVALAVGIVWLATHPPKEYVFIPDRAHPLGPAVTVRGVA